MLSCFLAVLATTFPPITPTKVTQISLIALSPWNLLLSWKIPDGINPSSIIYYEITGSIVADVYSKTVYNMKPISDGVLPSFKYIISMRVIYIDGQASDVVSLSVTTPRARKLPYLNILMF